MFCIEREAKCLLFYDCHKLHPIVVPFFTCYVPPFLTESVSNEK